jgi:hypothetical protein
MRTARSRNSAEYRLPFAIFCSILSPRGASDDPGAVQDVSPKASEGEGPEAFEVEQTLREAKERTQ